MNHGTSITCANVAVLTVSDTRTIEDDQSGLRIVNSLTDAGHTVTYRKIVRDDQQAISALVSKWALDQEVDAIIVNGGTGPSPRDVTPDAILPLLDVVLEGFGELFRHLSYMEIGAAAMLSRATAGWIETGGTRTPVFLLPGSPAGVTLALTQLIVPQLGHLLDVCSLEASS